MAIRTDIITVDWDSSPRIIWIDISETECDVQDIYDTCRFYEAQSDAMDEKPIIDAAGGEPLGGGVYVGITVSLLNAQYAFADRPGPAWVICNMTGGNVVAFTDETRTVEMYPRYPTAYVSADRSSSSSATTQEQADIQYSSFNGGVTYDEVSGVPGTEYPIGTPRLPVGNVYDARAIAQGRGFRSGYIVEDMTIPEYELDMVTPFEIYGFTFYGSGKTVTDIAIPAIANVHDNTYVNAHVQGTLDGDNVLEDCLIDNLVYIKGYLERCVLAPGTIVLGGNDTAHFLDCFSGVPGTGTPTIDMNGSGQALAMRNYNGGIKLVNKTGTESVSIDLNSGQVKIDMSTVTNGTVVVRGVGKVVEATSGNYITSGTYGDLTIINEAINLDTVATSVWSQLIDAGYTAEELMRVFSAVLAGKVSGVGTDTEVFLGMDDSTARVTTTLDVTGNRIDVTRNV